MVQCIVYYYYCCRVIYTEFEEVENLANVKVVAEEHVTRNLQDEWEHNLSTHIYTRAHARPHMCAHAHTNTAL